MTNFNHGSLAHGDTPAAVPDFTDNCGYTVAFNFAISQGAAGATGAVGSAGSQGPIGLTGAQGATGLTSSNGAAGSTGSQGQLVPRDRQDQRFIRVRVDL
jgi:hypothetical protein